MKFKVGDTVRIANYVTFAELNNKIGKIVDIEENREYGILVAVTDWHNGHDGCGKHKYGNGDNCWWFDERWLNIEKCTDEVKIHFHNNKTIATLHKNGKTLAAAVARCHPDDEFDALTGAYIAIERLYNREHMFCGKAVYIGETDEDWTRGKIYEISTEKDEEFEKNFVPIVE